MASIKMKDDHEFDGKKLFKHVADYLPSYARPRFLRLQVQPLAIEFSYPLSETLVITNNSPYTIATTLAIFTAFSRKLNKAAEISEIIASRNQNLISFFLNWPVHSATELAKNSQNLCLKRYDRHLK